MAGDISRPWQACSPTSQPGLHAEAAAVQHRCLRDGSMETHRVLMLTPHCLPTSAQVKAGAEQRLYNMIDVLSAGAMR